MRHASHTLVVLTMGLLAAWACGGEIASDGSGGPHDTTSTTPGGPPGDINACPDFQSVPTCQPAPGAVSCTRPVAGCGLDALPTGLACSDNAQCSLLVYPCADWQQYVGSELTDGYICTCFDSKWSCTDCDPGAGVCAEAGAPAATGSCTPVPAGGGDGDSGTPVVLAEIQAPSSIVVDADNAYVASYELGPVYEVPLDGGPAVLLDPIGQNNVAINSTAVYTVAGGGGDVPQGIVAACAKTGCAGNYTTLATNQTGIWGVAADDQNVYWTNQDGDVGVFKAPVGGGAPTLLAAGQADPIIASGGWLFYAGVTDSSDGSEGLMALPIDGGTPLVLVPPVSSESVETLAADCTSVYYAMTDGTVAQVPRGGGTSTTLVAGSSGGFVTAVAVDAARVYFTDALNQTVQSVPIGGGSVTTLATGQAFPIGVAVDANYVYWTNRNGNTVMKLAK